MTADPVFDLAHSVPDHHWGHAARRDLLEQITDLLLRHDLGVTPRNLAIAHGIVSGATPGLARLVCERELAGECVSQQYLDENCHPDTPHDPDHAGLERLMDRIEHAIGGFAQTTAAAHSETGAIRTSMQGHIEDVGIGAPRKENIVRLSNAVLDTLQRVQQSMQRSQDRTRDLQQQLDKARIAANSDHLTGLPNRRAFEHAFGRFRTEAAADGQPLFVAICDVDHFKRINDGFGHETGDRLLRAIAGVLQRYTAQDCFVARHGGEEFVILIRGANAADALARVNRARRELAGRKFVARRSRQPIGQVTFSAGLADVFATDNPRDALAAADAALYRAKQNGRNQVVSD